MSDIYTELDKLRALTCLAANGGDLRQTAEQTGIDGETVLAWTREPAITLDERLERIAHQLITVMPDKLDEADLQQITRALAVVLDNLRRTRAQGEQKRGDVYEKLARLMDRYAADKRAGGDHQPTDGS